MKEQRANLLDKMKAGLRGKYLTVSSPTFVSPWDRQMCHENFFFFTKVSLLYSGSMGQNGGLFMKFQ